MSKRFFQKMLFFISASGMLISVQPAFSQIPNNSGSPAVVVEDADFWIKKGALCATYGNDKAAVNFFQKAIGLDPESGEAYYLLGISHGELGNFKESLDALNTAVSLNPGTAVYFYARGRVYLLSGRLEQAMADFRIAADGGNTDARRFLAKREMKPGKP